MDWPSFPLGSGWDILYFFIGPFVQKWEKVENAEFLFVNS